MDKQLKITHNSEDASNIISVTPGLGTYEPHLGTVSSNLIKDLARSRHYVSKPIADQFQVRSTKTQVRCTKTQIRNTKLQVGSTLIPNQKQAVFKSGSGHSQVRIIPFPSQNQTVPKSGSGCFQVRNTMIPSQDQPVPKSGSDRSQVRNRPISH